MARPRIVQDAPGRDDRRSAAVFPPEGLEAALAGSGVVWRVTIPNWLPISVNALLRLHWSKRSRAKRADAAVVAAHCNAACVPGAPGKRRVRVLYRQRKGRLSDPDNRWKSLLDALVVCGRLVDDSPVWCELGGVVVERGAMLTVIELEDIA